MAFGRKKTEPQEEEPKPDPLKEIGRLAERVGEIRKRLAMVQGLIAKDGGGGVILFRRHDGVPSDIFVLRGEYHEWNSLVSVSGSDARPILGAAETALREQLRIAENELRQLGVPIP
jgi:hypothetical protein